MNPMRNALTIEKLRAFMSELGRMAAGPGNVYFAGGATALMLGLRDATVGIARLKERLSVNVELAAPDDFIPTVPGWKERSICIETVGQVSFFHYDLYSQVLSKLARGLGKDIADAEGFMRFGKLDRRELMRHFQQIEPALIRYPGLNAEKFKEAVERFAS